MKGIYLLLALLLSVGGVLITGCSGSGNDRISSIIDDPNRFLDRQVRVAGEVTQVYELPLGITNLAAYRINDGTGQIWVVSRAGAPLKGDRVGLRGRVEPIAKLNMPVIGNVLGNVIEEQERHRG